MSGRKSNVHKGFKEKSPKNRLISCVQTRLKKAKSFHTDWAIRMRTLRHHVNNEEVVWKK